jgi:hypothetical protein
VATGTQAASASAIPNPSDTKGQTLSVFIAASSFGVLLVIGREVLSWTQMVLFDAHLLRDTHGCEPKCWKQFRFLRKK